MRCRRRESNGFVHGVYLVTVITVGTILFALNNVQFYHHNNDLQIPHNLIKRYDAVQSYNYIINPEGICEKETDLWLLVYVHSAPANENHRRFIRDTWGKRQCFSDFGLTTTIHTPNNIHNRTNYLYLNQKPHFLVNIIHQRYIIFKVKALSNVHITLAHEMGQNKSIEVVIGSGTNTASEIRNMSSSGIQVVAKYKTGPDIGPNSSIHFNTFWISWHGSEVSVGSGCEIGESAFMSYMFGDTMMQINHVGIGTGYGSTGEWKIQRDRHATRVVFMMGRPGISSLQKAIDKEACMYGDIVQEDFKDSYQNLTHKAVMSLNWVSQYCSHATYVLKVDDDIFVNMFNLVPHLESLQYKQPISGEVNKLMLCCVWKHMKVIRKPTSKWYLSPSKFPEDTFPTYCSGSAYIMSSDVVTDLHTMSQRMPFLWVDDIYITGILARELHIEHQNFKKAYLFHQKDKQIFVNNFMKVDNLTNEITAHETLMFSHVHGSSYTYRLKVWEYIVADRTINDT